MIKKKYYKREAESEFGAGMCYLEIHDGWVTRQAEHYSSVWRWGDDAHPEWLADQPESELGMHEATPISPSEFEAAWQQAREMWRPVS